MRIVSLLPSATELLCAVGGCDLLVGRSHECDHPSHITHLPVLTRARTTAPTSAGINHEVSQALEQAASLYQLDDELLRSLKPDLIITQDLCDVCSIDLKTVRAVAEATRPSPAVLSLNPTSVEDVFDDYLRVGGASGLAKAARTTMVAARERFEHARDHVNPYVEGSEVAFLEWADPLFVGGHWIPQMVEVAGGRHGLNPAGAKSRQIDPEELIRSQPEWIVLCPCGFTLERTRDELSLLESREWWAGLPAVRAGRVAIVDGSAMFSRPGPRLIDAFLWLVGWLHGVPHLVPSGFPVQFPLVGSQVEPAGPS